MNYTTQNPPTMVVVEEPKRRKGLIWVAGAAALALAAGGGTFALWQASGQFDGGTIVAGNLDLTEGDGHTFWDISDDRADIDAIVLNGTTPLSVNYGQAPFDPEDGVALEGHQITDINDWRMVPGDTALVVFSLDAELEGDNLVAELWVEGIADSITNGNPTVVLDEDGEPVLDDDGEPVMSLDYRDDFALTVLVFNEDGEQIVRTSVDDLTAERFHIAYLAAPDIIGGAPWASDAEDVDTPVISVGDAGSTQFVVALQLDFRVERAADGSVVDGGRGTTLAADAEDNRVNVFTTVDLSEFTMGLSQVRQAVGQFN